jgi:hypothetical protein
MEEVVVIRPVMLRRLAFAFAVALLLASRPAFAGDPIFQPYIAKPISQGADGVAAAVGKGTSARAARKSVMREELTARPPSRFAQPGPASAAASRRQEPAGAPAPTIGPVINPANGHSYYATEDMLTWNESEAWAMSLGGHLVTINDAAENAWIRANFTLQNDWYWLGGRDDANTSDKMFEWASGDPWEYANWFPGEPDDNAGLGGQGDYVVLDWNSGNWLDTNGFFTQCGGIAEFVPTIGVTPVGHSGAFSVRTIASRDGVIVRFELSREMPVELAVFDVRGRAVRNVFTGTRTAGTHDVFWDERDQAGRHVGRGLYFVSVRAEGNRGTGRVVVAR